MRILYSTINKELVVILKPDDTRYAGVFPYIYVTEHAEKILKIYHISGEIMTGNTIHKNFSRDFSRFHELNHKFRELLTGKVPYDRFFMRLALTGILTVNDSVDVVNAPFDLINTKSYPKDNKIIISNGKPTTNSVNELTNDIFLIRHAIYKEYVDNAYNGTTLDTRYTYNKANMTVYLNTKQNLLMMLFADVKQNCCRICVTDHKKGYFYLDIPNDGTATESSIDDFLDSLGLHTEEERIFVTYRGLGHDYYEDFENFTKKALALKAKKVLGSNITNDFHTTYFSIPLVVSIPCCGNTLFTVARRAKGAKDAVVFNWYALRDAIRNKKSIFEYALSGE